MTPHNHILTEREQEALALARAPIKSRHRISVKEHTRVLRAWDHQVRMDRAFEKCCTLLNLADRAPPTARDRVHATTLITLIREKFFP